jgi:hypothetical protein
LTISEPCSDSRVLTKNPHTAAPPGRPFAEREHQRRPCEREQVVVAVDPHQLGKAREVARLVERGVAVVLHQHPAEVRLPQAEVQR